MTTPETLDWVEGLRASLTDLPLAARAELARFWTRAAERHHHDIAVYSRFSLGLISLAAPPGLLTGAHRAAFESTRHARTSFALASLFAGEPIGPKPLAGAAGGLEGLHRAPLLRATLSGACVASCVASALAEGRARVAREPALIAYFEELSRDFAEHAAFAWRAAQFLLESADTPADAAELRASIVAMRGELVVKLAGDGGAEVLDFDDPTLAPTLANRYGLLTRARALELSGIALSERVIPALTMLEGDSYQVN
ncbi:MAG: hypothetical protein U0271_01855 [Polyangiaceae bacterium]